MLVLVHQGDQLHNGSAPDAAHIVLDQVQQDLVQVLSKQVPHNLILIGTLLLEVLIRHGRIWYVEDVPDEKEAVVHQTDLHIGDLVLPRVPTEVLHNNPGCSRISEHLLGLDKAIAEFINSLSSHIRLGQNFPVMKDITKPALLVVKKVNTRPGPESSGPPLFTYVQSNPDSIRPGACCCCCCQRRCRHSIRPADAVVVVVVGVASNATQT